MCRIGRATRAFALGFLMAGFLSARADDPPKPDPKAVEDVDRVLVEWHRKASAIQSVEVRFRMYDHSLGMTSDPVQGRAVLAAPNLALMELSTAAEEGKAASIASRWLWDGRSVLQFQMSDRIVTRYPLQEKWTASPSLLRLPFFYRMNVEEAKRDFDWAVLQEDETRILLQATSKANSAASYEVRTCLIALDAKSFLPKMMSTYDELRFARRSFHATDIKINAITNTDDITAPCLDSWTVSETDRGLARLLK